MVENGVSFNLSVSLLTMEARKDVSITPKSVVDVTIDREAPPKHWYIAQVHMKCEKKVAQKISAIGYETFVATQEELHIWSDRKKKVERVLLPLLVFFKADEKGAKEIERLSFVYCLMKAPGQKKASTIPDDQMDRFRFMLGNSDTEISIEPFEGEKGDPVRIIRGKLAGLEGLILDISSNKPKVSIVIDYIGCACVTIDKSDLEILK